MQPIKRLDQFHNTRKGHLVFALIELALFYLFTTIAFDTASMLAYLIAAIFLGGAIHNIYKFFKPYDVKAVGAKKR